MDAINLLISWLCNTTHYNCIVGTHKFTMNIDKLYIKYPIVINKNCNSLDRVWNKHYDYLDNCIKHEHCIPSPTREWCIENKLFPKCVFDIAISNKNQIVHGIIINPISAKRKENIQSALLKSKCLNVLEIDMKWIVSQSCKPNVLRIKRLLTADNDIKNVQTGKSKWIQIHIIAIKDFLNEHINIKTLEIEITQFQFKKCVRRTLGNKASYQFNIMFADEVNVYLKQMLKNDTRDNEYKRRKYPDIYNDCVSSYELRVIFYNDELSDVNLLLYDDQHTHIMIIYLNEDKHPHLCVPVCKKLSTYIDSLEQSII
jgi:hypothetical protein